MRRIREAVLPMAPRHKYLPKTIRQYRAKYKGVSRILDAHPEILEAVVRIAESEFLQDFLRTRKRAVMDHTFWGRCLQAVRPATWKRLNELLGRQAAKQERIAAATIRTDTTVVETNIHWPTDSSLLWDTWRVASRRLRDFADKVLALWQVFRAGIEGTISGLKRAFRLARCFYRGFRHFRGAIGLGVFAHNLVVLADPGVT